MVQIIAWVSLLTLLLYILQNSNVHSVWQLTGDKCTRVVIAQILANRQASILSDGRPTLRCVTSDPMSHADLRHQLSSDDATSGR